MAGKWARPVVPAHVLFWRQRLVWRLGAQPTPPANSSRPRESLILCFFRYAERHIKQGYEINAHVVGSEKPMIVLTTGAVNKLTSAELTFLIGHEVGHVKSQHAAYHMLATGVLPVIQDFLSHKTLGFADMVSRPMQLAILGWYRKSELTCDRAGLLASQDLDTVVTAMTKTAHAQG